mmetsp:Transcript_26030/g.68310  ORF Transcript_26030/g.68310 Transcript_26030/m.68310 type:complete len:261 (-) Transcript_26030:556-1338(-)
MEAALRFDPRPPPTPFPPFCGVFFTNVITACRGESSSSVASGSIEIGTRSAMAPAETAPSTAECTSTCSDTNSTSWSNAPQTRALWVPHRPSPSEWAPNAIVLATRTICGDPPCTASAPPSPSGLSDKTDMLQESTSPTAVVSPTRSRTCPPSSTPAIPSGDGPPSSAPPGLLKANSSNTVSSRPSMSPAGVDGRARAAAAAAAPAGSTVLLEPPRPSTTSDALRSRWRLLGDALPGRLGGDGESPARRLYRRNFPASAT